MSGSHPHIKKISKVVLLKIQLTLLINMSENLNWKLLLLKRCEEREAKVPNYISKKNTESFYLIIMDRMNIIVVIIVVENEKC